MISSVHIYGLQTGKFVTKKLQSEEFGIGNFSCNCEHHRFLLLVLRTCTISHARSSQHLARVTRQLLFIHCWRWDVLGPKAIQKLNMHVLEADPCGLKVVLIACMLF